MVSFGKRFKKGYRPLAVLLLKSIRYKDTASQGCLVYLHGLHFFSLVERQDVAAKFNKEQCSCLLSLEDASRDLLSLMTAGGIIHPISRLLHQLHCESAIPLAYSEARCSASGNHGILKDEYSCSITFRASREEGV